MNGNDRTARGRLRLVASNDRRLSADELLRETAREMADRIANRLPEIDPADPGLSGARRVIMRLRAAAGQ